MHNVRDNKMKWVTETCQVRKCWSSIAPLWRQADQGKESVSFNQKSKSKVHKRRRTSKTKPWSKVSHFLVPVPIRNPNDCQEQIHWLATCLLCWTPKHCKKWAESCRQKPEMTTGNALQLNNLSTFHLGSESQKPLVSLEWGSYLKNTHTFIAPYQMLGASFFSTSQYPLSIRIHHHFFIFCCFSKLEILTDLLISCGQWYILVDFWGSCAYKTPFMQCFRTQKKPV